MAVFTGVGWGTGSVSLVFFPDLYWSTPVVSAADSNGFTVTTQTSYGSYQAVLTGSGLTYPGAGGMPTGGTITGLQFTNGINSQIWSGLNVSAAALSAAVAAIDSTAYNNLFFSGADTFTYSPANGGQSLGFSSAGFGGDDVFNISGWDATPGFLIDGGTGSDTLNITGGVGAPYGSFTGMDSSSGNSSNFAVTTVETVNLAAGFNYTIIAGHDIVATGKTLTVDGSHLGASNRLIFSTNTGGQAFWVVTGNLVLLGGAGDDILEGGTGTNTFNGGGGNNTVDFMYGQQRFGDGAVGVTADLSNSGFQNFGTGFGSGTFANIQNIIGTPYNDTLTGDNGNNVINGGGNGSQFGEGPEILNGLGGNDTIIAHGGRFTYHTVVDGGTGTDTVVLDNARSGYTFSVSGGTVTLTDTTGLFGSSTIALTNVEYAQFTDQTTPLFGPVVTTALVGAVRNHTFALSDLFSVTDVLGLPITEYQLWDATRDPLSGHFEINGVAQAAGTVIDITAAQLSQVTFVTNKASDDLQIRAFDGTYWSAADNAAWAPFKVAVADWEPHVSTGNITRAHLHTYALSSLFAVSDADGDAITQYQLWDGTPDPNSGHFEINGVAQAAGTIITITDSQLPQTTFVTGIVGDALQIRASDGILWSAADTAAWAPFTISIPSNNLPQLSTASQRAAPGQSLALSSLFSVSDADGDTMTRYQLWDSTTDTNSGHFVVNGVSKPAGTVIDVTAAQLSQTSFVAGTVNDNLQIRTYDGIAWSAADTAAWAPFTVGPLVNNAPVLQTSNRNIARGVTTALSSLITVSDADSDSMTKYQLWDGTRDPNSGHFEINGVAQAAGTVIDITAAQLAQTTFVTGKIGDSLQVRAYDSISWSAADTAAWAPFTVSVPDAAPVLSTGNVSKAHFESCALSSLITVSDADGDSMTRYQLWDGTRDPNSGHFEINGTAQPAGTVIEITAAQLAQTTFVTGTVGDNLQIRAFDGITWSAADTAAWAPFTVSVPAYTAPHVTTAPVNAAIGQTLALSSLISVSDADGDSMTKYQLWDSTANPLSGHWVVNGVAQPAGTVIEITAAQFGQTSFVAGRVNDTLQVRAFDGRSWSDADTAAWAPFTVSVPANSAPVLTTQPVNAMHGRSLALSSLFSVTDADGDSMTRYQLWDSTRDPNSGHFEINGVAQAASTVIDITAAQLAQTAFVTGTSVSDSLQIRAFDGMGWSDADNAAWQPFTVTVAMPYTAPVASTNDVNTTPGQTLALSSLFSVSDADGDTMTRYQLWDSTADPNSGHFMVNGVAKSASTVIDITAAQFAQTSFLTGTVGDSLQIRAFDGVSWTAADTAAWAPFHINV